MILYCHDTYSMTAPACIVYYLRTNDNDIIIIFYRYRRDDCETIATSDDRVDRCKMIETHYIIITARWNSWRRLSPTIAII